MNEPTDRSEMLGRLSRVVEAYGGDHRRWPKADQTRLVASLEGDRQAQNIVREGMALDRLLLMARSSSWTLLDRTKL